MILPFAGEGQPANTGDHKVSFPAFPQFANNIQANPRASPCAARYRAHGGPTRGHTTTPLKTNRTLIRINRRESATQTRLTTLHFYTWTLHRLTENRLKQKELSKNRKRHPKRRTLYTRFGTEVLACQSGGSLFYPNYLWPSLNRLGAGSAELSHGNALVHPVLEISTQEYWFLDVTIAGPFDVARPSE